MQKSYEQTYQQPRVESIGYSLMLMIIEYLYPRSFNVEFMEFSTSYNMMFVDSEKFAIIRRHKERRLSMFEIGSSNHQPRKDGSLAFVIGSRFPCMQVAANRPWTCRWIKVGIPSMAVL